MKTIMKRSLYSGLILYTLFGLFLVPYLVKTKVVEIANKQINGKLSVESVHFNPFSFELWLDNLKLVSPQQKEIFTLDKLYMNFEFYSLFMGHIHFKDIEFKSPKVDVIYSKEKQLNLLDIVKPSTSDSNSSASSSKPLRFIIDKIAIDNGFIKYEDFTKETPYTISVGDLGFAIKGLDTGDQNATNRNSATSVFRAVLNDGGYIKIVNSIKSFSPFIVDGRLEFESSQLYTQWKYLKDKLNIEIADGKVSVASNYHLNLDDLTNLNTDKGSITISNLRVIPKDKTFDILNVASLKVNGISAMPLKEQAHISNISLSGLRAKIQRTGEKKIDWQEYLKYDSDANKSVAESEEDTHKKPFDLTIDDIDVKDFKVSLQDKFITPNVTTTLDRFDLHVKNMTTLGVTPLSYNLDMLIDNGFNCFATGSLKSKRLDFYSSLTCNDLDLIKFRPYIDDVAKKSLQRYDLNLKSGIISLNSKVNIKDENGSTNIKVVDGNFVLNSLDIAKKSTGEQLFTLNEFNLKDIFVDTNKSSVDVTSSALIAPKIYLARYKNGAINIDNIVVPKTSKQTKKQQVKEDDKWRVLLDEFDIKNADASFYDKMLSSPAVTSIDKLYLHASNIDSKKRSWLNYNLSAQVNKGGTIKASGKIRHTPLKQNGTIDIKKLPLQFLNPYINEYSYLILNDGYFNFKAKESFAPSKRSADLLLQGSLSLDKLFMNDTRDKSTILSFNRFSIPSYTFEYAPNRLYVDKALLDSFYVNAIIDENKTINFAKLSKIKPNDENQSVQTDNNRTKENSFPIKVMKIAIKNGSAKFADLSLPLKFHTDIHDLNGEIYGISNQAAETSSIDLNGIVDQYGSAKIFGSINSANPKMFTDMSVVFSNLALSNLSPYSADFAGYKIDEGKLFLDLGYKIDNSKLDASNSIVIKKIKLGDTIKDENVTVLPLGFVIALLEDNEGIIDIDLPIKGDMDSPDFKYGALVWKTIGGLITKAVTSPFKLLGSMLGIDTEGLDAIDFEPGKAVLLPPEREKLDNLAKLLSKRLKLHLFITGMYDEVADKKALQTDKLVEKVLKKSGITNEDEKKNALTADMLEDIYYEYAKEDKLDLIKDKLKQEYTDSEQFKQKYILALIDIDSSFMVVTDDELKTLANNRAKLILDYLTLTHHLESSRIGLREIQQIRKEDRWIKTKLEVNVK